MEHFFELPVTHNDQELLFKGRLVTFGYVYKFYILVNGQELVFERDNNEEFRVVANENDINKQVDPKLLDSILEVLKSLQS